MTSQAEFLQRASEVLIEELVLISSTGVLVDLKTFFKEINIFESVYSPVITGNILIGDNINLIKNLTITGGEYITIKLRTPGLSRPAYIYKTFRIFSITDRIIVDQSSQLYILNFISQEGFSNELSPLYSAFSGKTSDIVFDIFNNYFVEPRYLTMNYHSGTLVPDIKSELILLDESENEVKFVSPGWSPLKCFQWLASKSIPAGSEACNFVFFEGNKNFYFGPLETIFNLGVDASIGSYRYFTPGTRETTDSVEKMFQISEVRMTNLHDALDSLTSGRLSSRLVNINFMEKDYSYTDYSHIDNFGKYTHTSGTKAESNIPIIPNPTYFNPKNFFRINTIQPGLFDNANQNINEKMPDIFGNRLSNMLDLNTYVLEITIPGRTDIEVGSLIYIDLPDPSPVDSTDLSASNFDHMSSGRYLMTKINHKISALGRHDMICEVAKDSFINVYNDVY